MRCNCRIHAMFLSMFFFFQLLFTVPIFGQSLQQFVPGEIIVKFAEGYLDSTELEKNNQEFSIDSKLIKNKLHQLKLKEFKVTNLKRVIKKMRPHHKYSLKNGLTAIIPDLYNLMLIQVPKPTDIKALCKHLNSINGIEYAEPNYIITTTSVTNDQLFYKQKSLEQASNNDINASSAWDINSGSTSIRIGLLDSGIDYYHEDLGGSYGGIKVTGGWDFFYDDPDPWDDFWHGTCTAGIIGALRNNVINNNYIGIAGLTGGDATINNPGCQLLSFRVISSGNYSEVAICVNAIIEAVTPGEMFGYNSHVLANNYQFYGTSGNNINSFRSAITYSAAYDVPFVVAAGNNNGNSLAYPARLDENLVIAVGASNGNDERASFSNYGVGIDVVAPGTSDIVYTTKKGGGYQSFSGTSAAMPHVAGLVGLMKSVNPNLWSEDIQGIVKASAKKVVTSQNYQYDQIGWNNQVGHGRIDARKALEMLSAPWSLSHFTVYGSGSIVSTSNQYNMYFDQNAMIWLNLPGGQYKVKRYKVQKVVTFPNHIQNSVWGNGVRAQYDGTAIYPIGFSNTSSSETNFGLGFTKVISYNSNSATLETYAYEVWSLDGSTHYGYVPRNPQNVFFAYSVLGIPINPPTISSITQSPSTIYRGQNGYLTCNATGDELTYTWTVQSQPDFIVLGDLNGPTLSISNIPMLANKSGNGDLIMKPPVDLIVTCTVSNPAGSVARICTASVIQGDPPGGGCPFLFVNTDNGYVMDNNMLHRSEFEGNAGKDIKDVYKLNVKPVADKNKLYFKILELNRDHSYFDRIKLYAVDHPAGSEIGVTENNDIVVYLPTGVVSSSNALLNDKNVTDLIQYNLKSPGVEGVSNDRLFMNFNAKSFDFKNILKSLNAEGAADSVAVIMNTEGVVVTPVDPPKEMAGTVGGNEAAEKTFQRGFARREKQSVVIVPLNGLVTLDSLNINWRRDYDLQYAAITPVLYGGYEKKELNLVTADHSTQGNIKQQLKNVDKGYAELDTNGFITLSFNTGGNVKAGWVRDYVIETDGYYLRPGVGENKGMAGKSIQKELLSGSTLPTTFELNANYPNPFNPSTTIEYAVPHQGLVTVKVYDVLGREVATLVNDNHAQGRYKVTWNATGLSSGIYIYRMTAKDYKSVRKMLLIK